MLRQFSRRRGRQRLQHRDPCPGHGCSGAGGPLRKRVGHIATVAAIDRRHDRDRLDLDGWARVRSARLVAHARARRRRARWRRRRVFRVRELHDARLRRRRSGRALAAARADDRDERRAAVRLVGCRHFRTRSQLPLASCFELTA